MDKIPYFWAQFNQCKCAILLKQPRAQNNMPDKNHHENEKFIALLVNIEKFDSKKSKMSELTILPQYLTFCDTSQA